MHAALELLGLLPLLLLSYLEALARLLLPSRPKSVQGETVLVTGAGHGLGRATALEFAQRCCCLVLWDVNQHGIEETAAECKRLGATVHTFVVDCSKREEIYRAAEKVKKEIGDISILVNNAGVITPADLLSTQDHQIEQTFAVNILAHFWTTKAFLPTMMKNNHGHIVTVSSAAGHMPASFMLSYWLFVISFSSSKFAAVGFHKALTQELSALGKDGIKTTCLCPIFINTGFVKNPKMRLMPILEPDMVAKKLLEGILINQKMIFVPSSLNIFLFMEKILPERALAALNKLQAIQFDKVVGYRNKE
ncbi:PREDICTED: estradiol 17-beta-dehydrogenase 11-like isoform X1 [Gavialis gangeticus]|uniref:estradiol 17-beta-dehydrogenase 11-like isoform X1 n=1 Tax=Gavialis gangeticus TaxID=94835 RepID=UPI00092E6873|nr:PREDICTED: estradiol 17-beta-dehydrogenase 11-like isoform X1 [Gavialis gangeticus]